MTIYSVQGPDGRIYDIEGPEGASDRDVIAALQQHLSAAAPAPKAKPQKGFIAAGKSGLENIKGDFYAGLAGLGVEGAEAKARAQKEKAAALYQLPEFTDDPLEYIKGLAGQSLPYMAAPLVAGAAASPIGALAATGAAGAASAAQFTGSNLARQLDEGKTGAQLELGKAAAAALPQAALDVIGFKYVPGIRTLFSKAGIPITEEAAKGIAGRYILPAAKTAGVEGATEAGQQVFERLQAGLNLTDAEARKEYFDNFLGGAVLGGVISVPGTMLEGRRRPEQAATTETTLTPPEETTPPPAPPPPAAPEQLALAGPEKVPQLGYTPQPAAPAQLPAPAAPQPNVISLMDQHEELKNSLDPLADKIETARKANDYDTARALTKEYRDNETALNALQTKITELGGFTKSREEIEGEHAQALKGFDVKIAKLQNAITENSRADIRDYDAVDKAEQQLEKIIEQRAAAEEEFNRKQGLLKIKEVPVGENLSLFAADEAQPKSTKVLEAGAGPLPPTEEEKSRGKIDKEAIAAKEAEAESQAAQLVEFVKAGPQAATKENKDAAMAKVNAARAQLTALKEASQDKPAGALDEEIAAANIKLKQAMEGLLALNKSDIRSSHIDAVNAKSEKLNKLYDEIDALRGGKPAPTASPMSLFHLDNLVRTAVVNGDKKTIELFRRAQKEAERRGQRGLPEQEKLVQKMEQRLDLPGTVVERTVNDEEYDSIMDKVEVQLNKINNKQGNAKESYIQKAERLWKEMQTFDAAAQDESATAHQRAMARRTYNARLKEYETIINGHINPAREEIYRLYNQLYTKKEVGKASEIAEEKQKETDRAGRSEREVSKEVKRAKKLEEGKGIKAAPARVARELGYDTEEYQTLATTAQKKVDAKVAQYNAFVNKAKDQLTKIKEKKGDVSDAYKAKEASFVKEANERLKTLNAFKQSVADALDAKAEALGRAAPEMRTALLEATKERKKAAAETTQEVKSKRTTQETRKVAKLGVMPTGTVESKARSAARQTAFEENVIKPEAQARVEQAVKEVNKKPSEAKGNAMKTAFTKAAQKKAGPAFRTEGSAAGVVDPTEAKGRIVEIKSRLPKGMNLIYEPTLADMKQETLDMLKAEGYKEGTSFKGVVLGDGTIVVVGDQHTNMTDLEETLYHEMVGHYGIDTVIGLDRLQKYALDTDLEKLAKDLGGMSLWVKALDAMTFAKEQKGDPDLAALREIIAYTAQQRVTESFYAKASRFIKELIGMMRDALRSMGFKNMTAMSATDVFKAIKSADRAYQDRTLGPYRAADGVIAFRSKQEPASIAPSFVAKNPTEVDRLKANFLGLTGRVQFVDQYAALSEALKKGVDR
jgi:hypothetical protein